MLPKRDSIRTLCTWNNGEKAVVHLVEDSNGEKQIQKLYKPGFAGWMFREYLSIRYLSRWLDIIPKLVSFRPGKKELIISYIPGQRVLEWVLEHFGQPNLDLDEFRNFEAMERDPRITEAFVRFRESSSDGNMALLTRETCFMMGGRHTSLTSIMRGQVLHPSGMTIRHSHAGSASPRITHRTRTKYRTEFEYEPQ